MLNLDSPNGGFQYALVASIHHMQVDQHHKSCASLYKEFLHLYDFTPFTMPVDAAELKSFEKLNPSVSATAFVWEEDDNKPQHLCYV